MHSCVSQYAQEGVTPEKNHGHVGCRKHSVHGKSRQICVHGSIEREKMNEGALRVQCYYPGWIFCVVAQPVDVQERRERVWRSVSF